MNKSRPLVSELLYQLMLMAGIPIFVTVGLFFWQLYPQLTGNISQEQQSIATLAAEQTQQRIRTAEQQVLFFLELARENQSLGNKKNVSSLLSGFVKQNSYFDTLYLLNTKGVIKQIAIRDTPTETANKLYIGVDTSQSALFKSKEEHAVIRALKFSEEYDLNPWIMGSGYEYRRINKITPQKLSLIHI